MTELAPHIACTVQASEEDLTASLTGMVEHEEFPCLGARSVFRRENATIRVYDERDFERLLWTQLHLLNADDDSGWNDDVSSDPVDKHFAFSVAGTAFFVVGLHPGASRDASARSRPPWSSTCTNSSKPFGRAASMGD